MKFLPEKGLSEQEFRAMAGQVLCWLSCHGTPQPASPLPHLSLLLAEPALSTASKQQLPSQACWGFYPAPTHRVPPRGDGLLAPGRCSGSDLFV